MVVVVLVIYVSSWFVSFSNSFWVRNWQIINRIVIPMFACIACTSTYTYRRPMWAPRACATIHIPYSNNVKIYRFTFSRNLFVTKCVHKLPNYIVFWFVHVAVGCCAMESTHAMLRAEMRKWLWYDEFCIHSIIASHCLLFSIIV